jgi:hypothetical protein
VRNVIAITMVIIMAFLVVTSLVAHLPGPTPTPQAISNAQKDPKFLQYFANLSSSYPDLFVNYTYTGYNDIGSYPCGPDSPLRSLAGALFPFHSFTSSWLFFEPNSTPKCTPYCPKNAQFIAPFGYVAVEIKPSTGVVQDITFERFCT